jgi:hypothetical protein
VNGAAGAAAIAAVIKAIKASGVVVRIDREAFISLVNRNRDGLVVHSLGGIISTKHVYLMSYKGLAFYTRSREPISLPTTYEIVEARSVWMPG